MKKLAKTTPPPSLVINAASWTQKYIESDGTTSPWSRTDIKAALVRETGGKCAYCEGLFITVSFGDIEHIRPRKLFPEAVVKWENLTIACSRCNGNKGSKYDAALPFVDPFADDPADHLFFLGPFAFALTDRGNYTIQELGLNEAHRIEARHRAIETIAGVVERHQGATTSYMRKHYRSLIRRILEEGEYSVAVATYVNAAPIAMRLDESA